MGRSGYFKKMIEIGMQESKNSDAIPVKGIPKEKIKVFFHNNK